jgi:hypothetical protein
VPSSSPRPPAAATRSLDAARYRVLERRDVRTAVAFELAFIPLIVVAELVLLGWTSAVFAALTVGALAAFAALVVGWRLGLWRRPHPTGFAVGVVVYAMGVSAASTTPTIASMMNGMFAVVVIGCAVWMPWSPRWHAAFLVMSAVALAVGLAVAPISEVEVTSGYIVGGCAILTSAVGMWLVRRRHLRMWGQTIELRRQKAALSRSLRELETAQHRVRRLEGILPICASCKRIRDGDAWQSVERYVAARSDAEFSHGICPECAARLYPEEASAAP